MVNSQKTLAVSEGIVSDITVLQRDFPEAAVPECVFIYLDDVSKAKRPERAALRKSVLADGGEAGYEEAAEAGAVFEGS